MVLSCFCVKIHIAKGSKKKTRRLLMIQFVCPALSRIFSIPKFLFNKCKIFQGKFAKLGLNLEVWQRSAFGGSVKKILNEPFNAAGKVKFALSFLNVTIEDSRKEGGGRRAIIVIQAQSCKKSLRRTQTRSNFQDL